jgi:hypothetical protein
MSYVFVSYSHKDKVAVNRLVNTLKAAGYLIWLDHDTEAIPGGRSSRSPGYGKIVQGLSTGTPSYTFEANTSTAIPTHHA